ncbi:MAG TPA: twin-arginine translocase TatA/TatE family subunit [Verrucomicrobiae bacterium]|nr:twin-arginine translocase TatA/TatE family subunit [Verrucomicrobiae bacterium]
MMTTLAVLGMGGWEMVLILAVVLVLFGAKRLPELAKGLGQGIKEFKKATRDVTDEIQRSVEEDPYHQPPSRKELEYTQEHGDHPSDHHASDPSVATPPVKTETAGTVPHNSGEPKV